MWDYAQLSKIAKRCGGPIGLVAIIAGACLVCGTVIGSVGNTLVRKLKDEELPEHEASEEEE